MKRLSLFLLLVLSVVLLHAEEVRTDVLLNDGWSIRPISNPTPGLKGSAVTLPIAWGGAS